MGDYYFIGYFIYTFLFIGTFYGIRSGVMQILKEPNYQSYNISLIFDTLFVLLVSSYPLVYFIRNGVWL
jgi:hypothetical protein